jgi:Putative peptidoglycan binding domain
VARLLFARGVRGHLVKKLQRGLAAQGFDPGLPNGDYGDATAAAVKAFRERHGLGAQDDVDVPTWRAATRTPVPPARERVLQLTAAFEGHGFTYVAGNFDGAGLTWGIVGFTLKHGQLQTIVLEVEQRAPEVVRGAFGAKRDELLQMMRAPRAEQLRWADSISIGPNKTRVAEPWRSSFARFGEEELVQAVQFDRVQRGFILPSLRTVRELGFKTELGFALVFDVHVQNGSVTARAREQIRRELAAHPVRREQDRRVIVALAVSDGSNPQWRRDVLDRKLTAAVGAGRVHGTTYVLRNWGLQELPFGPRRDPG